MCDISYFFHVKMLSRNINFNIKFCFFLKKRTKMSLLPMDKIYDRPILGVKGPFTNGIIRHQYDSINGCQFMNFQYSYVKQNSNSAVLYICFQLQLSRDYQFE